MSRSFSLALKLDGRKCLVVGSTTEAFQRATALAQSGAAIRIVARDPSPELSELARGSAYQLEARPYSERDLDDVWLAVLTDRDPALAERIGRDAERARVFFCAVDIPEHGSFSHAAIARAGLVTFAISTEGRAPALGRRLRAELQRLLDESSLAEFADALAELRARTPNEARKEVLGGAVAGVSFEGRLALETAGEEAEPQTQRRPDRG